jgi:hypothetical protein
VASVGMARMASSRSLPSGGEIRIDGRWATVAKAP